MEESDVVENFFGVYLLYCKNPKFIGQTYIGYTVDPNRRIKQHNKGRKAGGAWRTSNRGPWSMVMIVHGFPNDIAALRFEWAWQHPERSRRLNHIPKKKPREKRYDYCLRILSEMLRIGPWNRLPLTVRWFDADLVREFPVEKLPPLHMPIVHGSVVSKKLPKSTKNSSPEEMELLLLENCYDCNGIVDQNKLTCLNPKCTLVSHVVCLSKHYLTPGEYVPVEGKCPRCEGVFLWGDIIRKMKGCYGDICIGLSSEAGDDFYSSDSE